MEQKKKADTEAANQLDVREVAEHLGIDFNRAGFAVCPVHGDKDPSLHHDKNKNILWCFGCKKAFDVIGIVRAIQGYGFIDALQWIGDTFGVECLEDDDRPEWQRGARRDAPRRLAGVEEVRRTRSKDVLLEDLYAPFRGRFPAEYVQDRGLLIETCRHWDLGHDNRLLRLLIPSRSIEGKLIAVSGRLYAKGCMRCQTEVKAGTECPACGFEQPPKYLHSTGDWKGRYLFGEHLYDKDVPYGIVVEGQLDAILLWQAGFKNVVATYGTNVTEAQVHRMVKMYQRLILVPDGDRAGNDMGWKVTAMAGRYVPVFGVKLPEGDDPGAVAARGEASKFIPLDRVENLRVPFERPLAA